MKNLGKAIREKFLLALGITIFLIRELFNIVVGKLKSKNIQPLNKFLEIDFIKRSKQFISYHYNKILQQKYGKQVLISLVSVVVLFSTLNVSALTNAYVPQDGYIVLLNKEEIGKIYTLNEEIVLEGIINDVEELIAMEENRKALVENVDLEIVPTKELKKNYDEYELVLNTIKSKVTYKLEAQSVTVDEKEIGYVKNVDSVKDVLEVIKNPYIIPNGNNVRIDFVENIEYSEVYIDKDEEIFNKKELYDELTAYKVEEVKHVIKSGDTLWDLAINNELTVDDIIYMNEGMTENTLLQIDDEITLVLPKPMVSVKTIETATYEDVAKRPIKYVKNDKEYVTYKKVVKKGKDGEKLVTADIVKINGKESDRLIIEEVITVEPIEEVVEKGTMNTPPKKAIGTFKMPTRGRTSDRFGTRGGRHKGIDIAAPSGTHILASDGGKVIHSGWLGGYGNLVIIDHQNGYKTYYGHNRKNVVKKGQMVAQGELIAYMGTTGDSTGNHLHFEIRVNGVHKNPFNYITY